MDDSPKKKTIPFDSLHGQTWVKLLSNADQPYPAGAFTEIQGGPIKTGTHTFVITSPNADRFS